MRVKKFLVTTLTTVLIMANTLPVFAASASKNTTEFGTLTGRTTISNNGVEKIVTLSVRTSKKAAHYVLKYDIRVAGTGRDITTDIEMMDNNVDGNSSHEVVEMYHWGNNGYKTTPIIAYTTHEARGNTAECVYLSETK